MDSRYHDEDRSGFDAVPGEMASSEAGAEAGAESGTESGTKPREDLDETRLQMAVESLREEENFPLGVAAGLVGALVGAVLWAVITVVTEYQIGWMAVGIGFLVGLAIRAAGKGMTTRFGIAGAVLALLGCLLGNLWSICGIIGAQQDISPILVFSQLDPSTIVELMTATFSPMDILFYGLAVYEGYKLSIRQVSEEELMERYHTTG